MIKIAPVVLVWACLLSVAFAQSAQESRGFEEEKRDLLVSTEVRGPAVVSPPLSENAASNVRFLNELYSRPVARVADAERIVAILKENEGEGVGSADGGPLRKGAAALLFCRVLDIHGGIWMRLFPNSERYALRELVFEGIMSAEGTGEIVTGRELVAIFVAAVDYMEKKGGRLE